MIAILTEKPSVANEIAVHLRVTQRKNGYWLGNGYAITWALGHLVGLAMPESYGMKSFQRENLPIIPKKILLIPRQIKIKIGYQTDKRALEQLEIIKEIFNRCDHIIVATDAGQEGELIFRYIYHYLQCKKPFERLWISSLTDKAITQGFKNLQKGHHFDNLYQSALARSQADWLIGINATQALSVQAKNGLYSLGSVQTPVLAMVCKRYREHIHFIPETFWKLQLQHTYKGITFYTHSETSFTQKTTAESHLKSIEILKQVTIIKVQQKEQREQPPLLYNITGLQKEAHTTFNFSASQTLAIAQSLYEQKLITYPRTGSQYISCDMWQEIPKLISLLEKNERLKDHAKALRLRKLQKRIVNDDKVTDHHALLITEIHPKNLCKEKSVIYQLIASRLLASVSAPCLKELTQFTCKVKEQLFTANGTTIISEGWRAIIGHFQQRNHQELPEIEQGEVLKIRSISLLEKQTQTKPLFTEATLLSAMENIGKTIEDKAERLAIKEVGLGTPATRASIIENLFRHDYILRQRKSLIPTKKGLQVYKIVKGKHIADVAMTGLWEKKLKEIEKGDLSTKTFIKGIELYTEQITKELLATKIKKIPPQLLPCPKCNEPSVRVFTKFVKCTDDKCHWWLFRTICGKILTRKAVKILLDSGKSPLLKGLKSNANTTFDVYLVLGSEGTTSFEFPVKNENIVKNTSFVFIIKFNLNNLILYHHNFQLLNNLLIVGYSFLL
ncbi:type IA DNA topoisomerase [uncultured Polaribacter sp.]|uniref:type IA DNA topoisomerase n=1 Tax=uncultured Polaribacter sp. TaxID=174711 RepID=UPI0026269225|nr:type IA DNA topoisomerase [uncultured Polaribacter sp.]